MNKPILLKQKSIKNKIIETYTAIIIEFFELLTQTELVNEFNDLTSILYIGINTINRVFEFVLIKTKNLEKTIYYSQKAYLYYLEYMDQILRSNLSHTLNATDATIFVYKKTIFDLHDSETNQPFNTMTNIMTLNADTLDINEKEWATLFIKLFKLTNVLFFWENIQLCLLDRCDICKLYLNRLLLQTNNGNITTCILENMQQKLQISTEIYKQILIEIIDKLEKTKTVLFVEDSEKNEHILTKFFMEESVLFLKFDDKNIKEFVRWIYA